MFNFFGIASAIFGSLGFMAEAFIVGKNNKQRVSGQQYLVPSSYINTLLIGLVILFDFEQFWIQFSLISIILLLSVGIIDTWYNFFYIKALEKNSASSVNPIVAINPLITLLITTFLPGANKPTWLIALAAITIVSGIYLLQSAKQTPLTWKNFLAPFKEKSFKYPLASAIFIGASSYIISYILEKQLASELGILLTRMLIIAIYGKIIFKVPFFPAGYKKSSWLLTIFGVETLYVTEWLFRVLAISHGNVILAVSLASTTPLFVLIWSLFFLKEKLTLFKIIGTGLIVAGIIISYLKF